MFFGRIYGATNCFQFYLTFKAVEEEEEPAKPVNYEFSELFSEPKEDAQVCEKKKADLRAKFEINQINRGHTGVKVKKLSEINPPLSQRYGAKISEEEKARLKRQSFPKLGFCENEDLKGLQEENQEEEGEEEENDFSGGFLQCQKHLSFITSKKLSKNLSNENNHTLPF